MTRSLDVKLRICVASIDVMLSIYDLTNSIQLFEC